MYGFHDHPDTVHGVYLRAPVDEVLAVIGEDAGLEGRPGWERYHRKFLEFVRDIHWSSDAVLMVKAKEVPGQKACLHVRWLADPEQDGDTLTAFCAAVEAHGGKVLDANCPDNDYDCVPM